MYTIYDTIEEKSFTPEDDEIGIVRARKCTNGQKRMKPIERRPKANAKLLSLGERNN
jgi:hypothetical protein